MSYITDVLQNNKQTNFKTKLKKQYFYWSNILLYVSVHLLKYLICVLCPPLVISANANDTEDSPPQSRSAKQEEAAFYKLLPCRTHISGADEREQP